MEVKHLTDSWVLVWAITRHQSKVQTGSNRGTSGRKQTRALGLGLLPHVRSGVWGGWRWDGWEPERQMVGGCEGDRGMGGGACEMLKLYGARWTLCWGLRAENLPRLSPTLQKPGDWRKNYEGGRGCFQKSAISFQHPVALLAGSLHPGVQTPTLPSPELQWTGSPTL